MTQTATQIHWHRYQRHRYPSHHLCHWLHSLCGECWDWWRGPIDTDRLLTQTNYWHRHRTVSGLPRWLPSAVVFVTRPLSWSRHGWCGGRNMVGVTPWHDWCGAHDIEDVVPTTLTMWPPLHRWCRALYPASHHTTHVTPRHSLCGGHYTPSAAHDTTSVMSWGWPWSRWRHDTPSVVPITLSLSCPSHTLCDAHYITHVVPITQGPSHYLCGAHHTSHVTPDITHVTPIPPQWVWRDLHFSSNTAAAATPCHLQYGVRLRCLFV